MQGKTVIHLDKVFKTYQMGDVTLNALNDINLRLYEGEYICIMGPSGCGKSTLLNLLGCLDRPSHGSYFLNDEDVSRLNDDNLSDIRGKYLGFIFQSYNLIQQLTVVENIEVPLYYQGVPGHESREIAIGLAEQVGLADRLYHKPFELSGGQQQRVGIARSLANDPLVLLADEPTGNLDSRSGNDILQLFDKLNTQGKTIIMVTHDNAIAKLSSRVVRLLDGKIESDGAP